MKVENSNVVLEALKMRLLINAFISLFKLVLSPKRVLVPFLKREMICCLEQ